MARNAFVLPPSSTSSSPLTHSVWKDINSTLLDDLNAKRRFFDTNILAMTLETNEPPSKRSEVMSKWALSHPLCANNVTAYVGQTAKMHCCLARLDRDLSVGL